MDNRGDIMNKEDVLVLWNEFGDVPMNPESECIESDWNGFKAGTSRYEIWLWFEREFNVRVYDLLYK